MIFKKRKNIASRMLSVCLSAAIAFPLLPIGDNGQKIKAAENSIRYGDVNGDNSINVLDIILLKSFMTENNTKNIIQKTADIDKDSSITCKDALLLSAYLNNQIPLLTYEKDIDSDNDGLSDYAEYYLCDTDPMISDTGNSGLTDDLKDTDNDGLTNKEEVDLGTSPMSPDSDSDKLSDYDEVKTYKTDPLSADKDKDDLSDFAEIQLGLDPNSGMSDSQTPDSQRLFEQELKSDNEVLSKVNSDNNQYKLSVTAKSSGYIDESAAVSVSKYSNYLQADAIYGDIVDIEYNDKYKLESMDVSFEIPENADNYYIFKYFKDVNMLLPVETKYDDSRVYTDDTQDGTYCVIDMDRWLAESSTDYSQNRNNVSDSAFTASNDIEIYFLLYVRNNKAEEVRNVIAKASRGIIDFCNKKGKNIKMYFSSSSGTVVISKQTSYNYISNTSTDDEITEMLSRSGAADDNTDTSSMAYSLTRALNKELYGISGENTGSAKYCFVVDVNFKPLSAATNAVIDEMKQYGVNFNFICNDTNNNIAYYDLLDSDGSHDKWVPDFSDLIKGKIITGDDDPVITYDYNTGLINKICLKSNITYDWYKAAKGLLSEEEIKALGLPDSDGDGKYDYEEILWDYVTVENGKLIFPTLEYLCKTNKLSGTGLISFIQKCKLLGINIDFSNIRVLVLKSNPMLTDSDFDGYNDIMDSEPSREGATEIESKYLDDTKIFECKDKLSTTIKENGAFAYEKLPGRDDVEKPVITYTRYADSNKTSLSRYRILFETKFCDYKITIKSDYKNKYSLGVYNTIDAVKSLPVIMEENTQNNTVTFTFNTLGRNWEYKDDINTSWEYFIELYVTPDEDIPKGANKYTVRFEGDDWIYAPYGGAVYNDEQDYSAVYLKDDALRVLSLRTEENWSEEKSQSGFPTEMAAHLGNHFYDGDESYLGMAHGGKYEIASSLSEFSTYSGLILSMGSKIPVIGKDFSPFADIATVTGAVSTYIAAYPIGETEFEKEIEKKLVNIASDDVNIILHRWSSTAKHKEKFECELWKGNYISRYRPLTKLSDIVIRTDFKSM